MEVCRVCLNRSVRFLDESAQSVNPAHSDLLMKSNAAFTNGKSSALPHNPLRKQHLTTLRNDDN
jgi:hypothetical protein